MENPFDEEFFDKTLKSLDALDKAAKKHEHDRKYTADGVLIEEDLEVWMIDYPLGKSPWRIKYEQKDNRSWFMMGIGAGGGSTKRSGNFRDMYADKIKAINQRIVNLHAEIDKVNAEEIFPRLNEVKALREIRDKGKE